MNFHIQSREVDGIVILDLNGRLVLGPASAAFADTVSEFIQDGKTSFVLNLEKVPMVDSSGLGVLIAALTHARSARGAVKLVNLSQRHIELLVLTKLSTEFEMFNDEQAAVDSFFPDRKRTSFDILEFVQSHASEPSDPSAQGDSPETPTKEG